MDDLGHVLDRLAHEGDRVGAVGGRRREQAAAGERGREERPSPGREWSEGPVFRLFPPGGNGGQEPGAATLGGAGRVRTDGGGKFADERDQRIRTNGGRPPVEGGGEALGFVGHEVWLPHVSPPPLP